MEEEEGGGEYVDGSRNRDEQQPPTTPQQTTINKVSITCASLASVTLRSAPSSLTKSPLGSSLVLGPMEVDNTEAEIVGAVAARSRNRDEKGSDGGYGSCYPTVHS